MSGNSSLQFPPTTTPAADDTVIVPMTADMVRKAAKVHLHALADSRTALMGKAYVVAFIDWFRQSAHDGMAFVAIDIHGDVVGYVIGAPLGYPQALSRHMFWISARAVLLRPWLFFKQEFRSGVLDRLRLASGRSLPRGLEPELPAPTLSLVAMGVTQAARGKKIGLRLVQACERKARELQMRSLRLSTHPGNAVACRLYESCGWQPFPVSGEMTYYFRILSENFEANR